MQSPEPSHFMYPDPYWKDRHGRKRRGKGQRKPGFPDMFLACGKHGERIDLPVTKPSGLSFLDDDILHRNEMPVGTETVKACRRIMNYNEYGDMHRRATCRGRTVMTSDYYGYMCMRTISWCTNMERRLRRNKSMGGKDDGGDYVRFKISCLQEPDCGRHGVAHGGNCYERCEYGYERNGPSCIKWAYYEPYCEAKDLVEGGQYCRFPGATGHIKILKKFGAHQMKYGRSGAHQMMYGRFGPRSRKYGRYRYPMM